jgi:hypothetical protein
LIERIKRSTNDPLSDLVFRQRPAGPNSRPRDLRTARVNGWCILTWPNSNRPLFSVKI